MRMGKRGRVTNQIGFKFPLRAPGRENKRTEETEETGEAGVSGNNKLLLGMVSKRKPGMEFLGKRLAVRKYFSSWIFYQLLRSEADPAYKTKENRAKRPREANQKYYF